MNIHATASAATSTAGSIVERAQSLGQRFAGRAAAADEADSFVAENYDALRQSGLIEAGVPRALGGEGAELPELARMLRVLAHHCSATALAFAMHTHQVAIPAWRWTHQKATPVEPLLKRVAAERIVLLSSGGSDWIGGSGRAERVPGGYRISARKSFTSGAPAGDLLMTSAVAREENEEPVVLHFGIPMTSPQVRIDPVWKTLGMRGTGSHDVVIDGHVVPDAAVALKRKAGEWHPLFQIIATLAFPLVYSVYLGVAESACALAIDLARQRRPDRHVLVLVGRMRTELVAAELAHRQMIERAMADVPSAQSVDAVMTGKVLVAHHAIAAVELAMEAAGGAGFYRSHGLERRFRDIQGARYHPLQDGPQAEYAGALALGLPVATIF